MNRRNFLSTTIAAAGLFATHRSSASESSLEPPRRIAPVNVSRDRIIREVVGLRPYRAGGFVVDAKRVGNKLLVHNYGHGGAGITLSWGTASMAVDLAEDFVAQRSGRARDASRLRFAVIGSGVNGLSTARLLQRRFHAQRNNITIYARDLPPNTTSNIAGGFWSPTSVYDEEVVSAAFVQQFRYACRTSHRAFQLLTGSEYGVSWIDTFNLHRRESSLEHGLPGGNSLYPNYRIHRDPEHYFGFPVVRQYSTMLIEPSIYLDALLRDFYIGGGQLVVHEMRDQREVMRVPADVIFNCTGLGARDLFGDEDLQPVRGQLVVLQPQPEIDYCYLGSGYMFPRRDGVILGGTYDEGDWSTEPRTEQTAEILASHAQVMAGVKG